MTRQHEIATLTKDIQLKHKANKIPKGVAYKPSNEKMIYGFHMLITKKTS